MAARLAAATLVAAKLLGTMLVAAMLRLEGATPGGNILRLGSTARTSELLQVSTTLLAANSRKEALSEFLNPSPPESDSTASNTSAKAGSTSESL